MLSRVNVLGILIVPLASCILLFLLAPHAAALEVTRAQISNGMIEIRGREAEPGAVIFWEEEAVTQANKGGKFDFSTLLLPSDCVADLSDGVEMIDVIIANCGPQGEPGAGILSCTTIVQIYLEERSSSRMPIMPQEFNA